MDQDQSRVVARFIGSESRIEPMSIRLTDYGQVLNASSSLFRDMVCGGCAVIPDSDFQAIGYTPEELRRYKYPGPRQSASAEFAAKHARALQILFTLRKEYGAK